MILLLYFVHRCVKVWALDGVATLERVDGIE